MNALLINPWLKDSAIASRVAETLVVSNPPPVPDAASELISESVARTLTPCAQSLAADTTACVSAAFSDEHYIPELFSVFAERRSLPIVSPPLPKAERDIDSLALNAVRVALNLHPRDLDNDPPPLFLRSPSKSFLNALFDHAFAADRNAGERNRSNSKSNNECEFGHRVSPMTG